MKKREIAAAMFVALSLSACGGAAAPSRDTAAGAPSVEAAAQSGSGQAQEETETGAEAEAGMEPETGAEAGNAPVKEPDGNAESGKEDIGIATSQEELAFPLGMEIQSDSFTGRAYIKPMIMEDEVYHFPQTNDIIFEPGARSSWHSHGGMVIIGTGGVGYYQEEGKPVQVIREGDVVECAPGVRHWHGAAPDSWFSQMVIYDSHYTPQEGEETEERPVTDQEYADLKIEEQESRAERDPSFMFPRAAEPFISETFSGPAYVSSILEGENVAGAPGLHYVVFGKGVINNWHVHEGGQILIATDGIGYHQIEGEPVEVLYPGDVALCPPGVKHWHGGSADTEFAHIAINTNPERTGLEWYDRITEEEYAKLPTEKPAD